MRRTALVALLVTVVLAAAVWALAPALEQLGKTSSPGTAPAPPTMSAERMDSWLREAPGNLWLLLGPRALAALLGVFFLVQEFLRPEKVRHGLLPPPDGRGPTVVATLGGALLLAIVFPLLVQVAAAAVFRPAPDDLRFSVITMVAALLPIAFLVTLRRIRLGEGRVPRAPTAIADGLRFTCIALLIVFPVSLAWGALLLQRGVGIEVQGPVQQFITPSTPDAPWVIAVFGVLFAPFNEEAVFRGLLYPSLRGRIPGGPLSAAVVVALLFAAIHGSLIAFVPLFVLALVLCWVMERTNSLLACVVVHVLHNAASLLPLVWRHVHGGAS